MGKIFRIVAFALCLLVLLPGFAVALAPSLDDIRDDDTQTTADPDASVDIGGVLDAGEVSNAEENTPDSGAGSPTFNELGNAGASSGAQDITKASKYKLSEGKAAAMMDAKLNTRWTNKKAKAKITITLPAGDVAGALFVEWYKRPSAFNIVEYGADGAEIRTTDRADIFPSYVGLYPLSPETRKLTLNLPQKGTSISALRVYSQGELQSGVQNWEAPHTKADLLLISAHQDDEFLYMGGTIPYYSQVRGKKVQVVYMANCGRPRYKEALNGLWAAGYKTYPDFVGLKDKYTKKLKDAEKAWNRTRVLDILVERIRKYKPEVIVTHDLKGEYGHGAHMLIASVIQDAIVQAADETKFKKSADTYGVWQAKKLYLHLYNDNQITMDWQTAYPELGGQTPSQLARAGYAAHKSQQKAFKYEDGGKYDNSKFGLAYTTVGEDVEKNDMFENIPEGDAAQDPALLLNPAGFEAEDDDTQLDDEEPLEPEDFGYEDEEDQGFDEVLDEAAGKTEAPVVTPPTESAPQGMNPLTLGLLVGVPVVLTGSAFGWTYGKKYLKKRRRAKRRAQKQAQDDTAA